MENEILLRALANDILNDLDAALVQFGTYSFDDKGADEVMELGGYTTKLRALPADQAGYVLKMVGVGRKDKRGDSLAHAFVMCLDDQPDEWFEVMLKTSGQEY